MTQLVITRFITESGHVEENLMTREQAKQQWDMLTDFCKSSYSIREATEEEQK